MKTTLFRGLLLGLAMMSLGACRLRGGHYHDAYCGHYYGGSSWSYVSSHRHDYGCGHYYYDGRWWQNPPRASVVISSYHVCDYHCGHYYYRGRRYYHTGHVHGMGCGHRYSGGLWISF